MILRSGGSNSGSGRGGSRSVEKGSPSAKSREAYAQSPRSARLRQDAAALVPPPPPPVPKFPMFHNTFAKGAAGSAHHRRASSGVKAGLGGLYKTGSQQRSPSRVPAGAAAASDDERDAKKRRLLDPRSDGVGADGGEEEEEEEETTPKASQKQRQLTTSSPVPDSDEVEGGAEAAMDVDEEPEDAVQDTPLEDDDDDAEDYWRLEEKDIVRLLRPPLSAVRSRALTPSPASALRHPFQPPDRAPLTSNTGQLGRPDPTDRPLTLDAHVPRRQEPNHSSRPRAARFNDGRDRARPDGACAGEREDPRRAGRGGYRA